jgi:hypothetical protein
MAAQKPTKQQIAQAKARAGGNNPVKVTNAGLKKLGSAAVIAASFTPVGRVAKTAATAVKAAKTAKAASTKRIPAAYTKTKQAKPIKVVNRTTPPIYKNSKTDAILEEQYAKAVKATKAIGGDPKKVKLTYNGKTIDYNGIK